jgi:hypothetical protein
VDENVCDYQEGTNVLVTDVAEGEATYVITPGGINDLTGTK